MNAPTRPPCRVRFEPDLDGSCPGGKLVVEAFVLGPLLTEGRQTLTIPVSASDPGCAAALAALEDAMSTGRAEQPVAVHLGGRHWLVDSTLWCDFSAALIELDALSHPELYPLPPGAPGEAGACS